MSNLKTDDILGARPRIRHAPRNLIHDQKLAQQQSQSPPNYNNQYDSYKSPFPQFQYQYPYRNNTRFYQRPEPSHEPQYNQNPNYGSKEYPRRDHGSIHDTGLSQSYYESPHMAGKSSVKIHSVNKTVDRYEEVKGNRPFILPKDAPVVNYDHYQQPTNNKQFSTSYTRAFSGADKQLYQKYQHNLNMSRQMAHSPPPVPSQQHQQQYQQYQQQQGKINTQNVEQRRSSARSVSSLEKGEKQRHENAEMERKEEKSKNLFRGLGYNIISNSKFEYDMQNRFKNSSSKWLD